MTDTSQIRLGLRENWRQFLLLVLINGFVGGMVGLERAVLPLVAEEEFGMASRTAILSFIFSFGIVKALANSAAGHLGDRWGRRRTLLAGWIVGLPVPFLVMWAPSWSWIVFANVLLGINQGLAWSSTVIMKIDLVGPRQRGLAMGLNEAAGYLAVSLAALGSGYVAAAHALRPHPFYLGVGIAVLGLVLTALFARETKEFARREAALYGYDDGEEEHGRPFREVLFDTSWRNRTLFSASQAGMVNNLNDGLAWGLFPIYFAAGGLDVERIGWLAALYPAVWGVGQLFTGWLSDRTGRKPLIVVGMLVQASGLFLLALGEGFGVWAIAMTTLGVGTALVYPTLLAAVGDEAHPSWRSSSVGVYRLWRDGGYAVGAVVAGILADLFGLAPAIAVVGVLTLGSGGIVAVAMEESLGREKATATDGAVTEASAR